MPLPLSPPYPNGVSTIDSHEEQVQRLLAQLEAAPQEVQDLFLARLLSALATKVPAKVAGKVFSAAQEAPEVPPKKQTGGNRTKKTDDPPVTLDPLLPQLHDPTDPIEAWEYFGPTQLREILPYEPEGYIDRMMVHSRLPKGKLPAKSASRIKKVEYILQRLEIHFGYQS